MENEFPTIQKAVGFFMFIFSKDNLNRFWKILAVGAFCVLFLRAQNAEAALGIDKNITQVKYPDSPVVYYLNHAQKIKKAYINEAVFLAYGNKLNQIKTIAPAYLNQWKTAEVVKVKNNPTVYIIRDGKKRIVVSEAEFLSLGYRWNQVMEISAFELSQYANTGEEDFNVNPYGFSVNLDSAKKTSLALGSTHNNIGTIRARSLNGENKVSTINVSLKGLYDSSAIAKVYLEKDGVVLAEKNSVNDRELTFNLGSKAFVIDNNETKINIFVDLNNCETCINNDLFLELVSSNVFGDNNKPAVTSASLKSATYKFVRSSGLFGELSITEESLIGYSHDIVAGSMGQVFGRFTVQEISGREDVLIEQIVLVNNGSLKNSYFNNLKLKVDNTVVAQLPTISGREIIFKPNYLKISKNSSKMIVVLGGILDGTNSDIDLQLQKVVAESAEYGVGVKNSSVNLNESNKIIDQSLVVNSASTMPGLKTLNEIKGTIISSFNLRSSAQEMDLNKVGFSLIKGVNTPGLDSLYIIDYGTGEVLQEVRIGSSDYYSVGLNKTLSSSNKSVNIGFVAKLPILNTGDYYQIVLKEVGYNTNGGASLKKTVSVLGGKYEARNNTSSVVVTGGSASSKTTMTTSVKTTPTAISNNTSSYTYNEKTGATKIVLHWPVSGRVNYGFHDPKYLYSFAHEGIDIAASQSTNVRAAQSGTVVSAVNGGLSGYSYVTIDHGNGYRTVYGHLSQISVSVGQQVNVSALLGKSGGTPGTSGAGQYSNGPHLHFELIKDGVYVDPELYLL